MDDQILIIFGMNIPETTGHQMIIYVAVAPYVCFCTTWGKRNKPNINFYSMQYHYLIKITHICHILSTLLAPSLTLYNCLVVQLLTVNIRVSAICVRTSRKMHSGCVDNVLLHRVFTRSSKRPADVQHKHVYFECICWKFAKRLLDRVNTPWVRLQPVAFWIH